MKLRGHVIIALPHLSDPNFHGSVVLLLEHSDEGSVGLVLNRPSPIEVGAITENLGVDWRGQRDAAVLRGGPVQPEMVWLLHGGGDAIPDSTAVIDGCWYTNSMLGLERLAPSGSMARRMFVGYAGWGPHQLDAEIREGVWLTAPAQASWVFRTPPEQLWERAMCQLGIDPRALITPNGMVH